jgi:hypothetical protein
MALPPSNWFFMVGLLEWLFVARIVSRLNAQDHLRAADINSGAALSSDEGVIFTPGFHRSDRF